MKHDPILMMTVRGAFTVEEFQTIADAMSAAAIDVLATMDPAKSATGLIDDCITPVLDMPDVDAGGVER